MRQFIRIAFKDATFQVPTMVVAAHRAIGIGGPNASQEQLTVHLSDTIKLFEDEQEIINYAANAMTWNDLKGQSMMLSCAPPNRSLKHSLSFQEWEFSDQTWLPNEPIGDADEMRLGFLVGRLISEDASCNFMPIGDPPTYAVAVMVGLPEEIMGYASGMQALAGMVKRKRDGQADIQEPGRIFLPH